MGTEHCDYYVAAEIATHHKRMRDITKRLQEASEISDIDSRIRELAQLETFRRLEMDIFPRRIPFARKLDEHYARLRRAQREKDTHFNTHAWEERFQEFKKQRDRFCLSNVATGDCERILNEELAKLRAA